MIKPVFKLFWLLLCVFTLKVSGGQLGPLTYEIIDGDVTITRCDRDAKGVLEIPTEIEDFPVASIRGTAFSGCSSLTSIIIPEGVTSIGNDAFNGCSSLTSITIPEGVTSIEGSAFVDCYSLESIVVPPAFHSRYEAHRIGSDATGDLWFHGRYRSSASAVDGESQAEAEAVLFNGFVVEITVSDGGSGYTETPAVTISGGGGTDASVVAIVENGSVVGLEIINAGRNYTSEPTVTIAPPPTKTPSDQPSIRMAPVIMVQGNEGSIKTIEVSDSPDGPWRFWMDVTATASGIAITDLDGQAHKRFYRVME